MFLWKISFFLLFNLDDCLLVFLWKISFFLLFNLDDQHDKKDFNLSENTIHPNAPVPIHGTRTHLGPPSSVLASKVDGYKYYDEPEVTVEAKIIERHFTNVHSDMPGDTFIEEIMKDKLKQWQEEDEQFFGHLIQEEPVLERNKDNATIISKKVKKQMTEWNDEKCMFWLFKWLVFFALSSLKLDLFNTCSF